MFTGFTDETIQFFLDLKFHNNTAYFHQEHDRYVACVQQPFYEMISDLGPDMLKIDHGTKARTGITSGTFSGTRLSREKNRFSITLNSDRTG